MTPKRAPAKPCRLVQTSSGLPFSPPGGALKDHSLAALPPLLPLSTQCINKRQVVWWNDIHTFNHHLLVGFREPVGCPRSPLVIVETMSGGGVDALDVLSGGAPRHITDSCQAGNLGCRRVSAVRQTKKIPVFTELCKGQYLWSPQQQSAPATRFASTPSSAEVTTMSVQVPHMGHTARLC